METDYRLKYASLLALTDAGVTIPRSPCTRRRLPSVSANTVFGVPLEHVIEHRGVYVGKLHVPTTLVEMAAIIRKELATEGLFRVSGSTTRMKAIQGDVNAGGSISGIIHDIAGLLKTFFRQLPDPLLTFRLYHPLISTAGIEDETARITAILLLMFELPPAHLHSTMYLTQLLHDVVSNPGSRMTASNLAAIFTPNILRPNEEAGITITSELEIANHSKAVAIVEILINHHDRIGVPSLELARRAGEFEETKARSAYLKMLVEKPKTSWWIFGRKKTKMEKTKSESLSSAQTLHLLHGKGQVTRTPSNISNSSTQSDVTGKLRKAKTASKSSMKRTSLTKSSESISSEPGGDVSDTEKENAAKKIQKESSKKALLGAVASPKKEKTEKTNLNVSNEERRKEGSLDDDPEVPSVVEDKDIPGFDSFMMY